MKKALKFLYSAKNVNSAFLSSAKKNIFLFLFQIKLSSTFAKYRVAILSFLKLFGSFYIWPFCAFLNAKESSFACSGKIHVTENVS
jgi:hypothetical protein